MSAPRYASYRDSAADYLGAVPAHWDVRPLKYLAHLSSGGTPSKERRDFWDGDIPWASAKDLKTEILRDTADHITDAALDEGGAQTVPVGAVIVLVRGMMLARAFPVCIAGQPTAINQDLKALLSLPGMRNDYLAWLLRGTAPETLTRLDEAGHGTKALRMEAWTSMKLPVPPPTEQQSIAAFLHRETAKIDALVDEQRRLIELLKEKRQAVISHAVTKGLDPSAPMKDSGVEWLGEAPVHWDVRRLRFLCDIETGDADTADAVEDGQYPFFVRSPTIERIDGFTHDCEAVLTAGDGAGVGKIYHHFEGKFRAHQRVYIFCNFRNVTSRFFFHFLAANFSKVALEGGAKSTVDSLRRPLIANFCVTVPPVREQDDIVAAVERVAHQFEELTAEAVRAIGLLQERRAALISAAVTGKIDVRDATSEAVAA